MSNHLESKTPYFGQIDFFLYLAPGSIVLLSIILFTGITPAALSEHSNIATSILGIFIAYFLGHAIYPLNYFLRKYLHKKLATKSHELDEDKYENEFFSEGIQNAFLKHPEFCLSQLLRYRSLARFTTAMLFPCIILGFGIAFYVYHVLQESASNLIRVSIAILSVILGFCAALGFSHRYERYWLRIKQIMDSCNSCPIK